MLGGKLYWAFSLSKTSLPLDIFCIREHFQKPLDMQFKMGVATFNAAELAYFGKTIWLLDIDLF